MVGFESLMNCQIVLKLKKTFLFSTFDFVGIYFLYDIFFLEFDRPALDFHYNKKTISYYIGIYLGR